VAVSRSRIDIELTQKNRFLRKSRLLVLVVDAATEFLAFGAQVLQHF
jgi:hypothetical protein